MTDKCDIELSDAKRLSMGLEPARKEIEGEFPVSLRKAVGSEQTAPGNPVMPVADRAEARVSCTGGGFPLYCD